MPIEIESYDTTARFDGELIGLKRDIQKAVGEAIKKLIENPNSNAVRLHPLSGYGKPTIWKMDVFPDHSWQITLEIINKVAVLRRVATHKDLDRSPR